MKAETFHWSNIIQKMHNLFHQLLLLVFLFLPSIYASCPNLCSGNGVCNVNNTCVCYQNYTRLDCSGYSCPNGTLWFDRARSTDVDETPVAHSVAECAGHGTCNRDNGICDCGAAWTGRACERRQCPGSCSGNGVCTSMYNLGKWEGVDTTTDGFGALYTNWDGHMTYGCLCDWGYYGPHCGFRKCPKGDDPEITNAGPRSITITTANSASAAMSGSFKLSFQGFETTFNADGSAESSSACVTFIQALGNVKTATCTQSSLDSTTKGCVYTIAFTEWPVLPMQNNIHTHDGNPPLSDFVCATSSATASSGTITCAMADVRAVDVYEYLPCSRRGKCAISIGVCACATGFNGKACENIGLPVATTCDSPDLTIHGTCSSLASNEVLHVMTTKTKYTDFNLIETDSAGVQMTRVGGNGNLTIQEGGIYVDVGGSTILTGGLKIIAGGGTVTAGGLSALTTELGYISTLATTTPALGVHASVTGTSFTSTALQIKTNRAANNAYNLLRVGKSTDVTYTWTSVDTAANTISLDTVTGLAVNDLVTSSITTDVSGLIGNTLYRIKSVNTGTKKITLVLGTVAASDVSGTNAISLSTYGSSATSFVETTPYDYMTVDGTGHTQITTAGLLVTAGGMTITAGGLHQVNTGTTINAGGLTIAAGGATITNVGLRVLDGPSHASNTATNAPALTVHATASGFSNTLATIKATREASSAFKLQEGFSNGVTKTSVNGTSSIENIKIS